MIKLSKSLPIPPNKGYALFDSWFTCPKVLDAYAASGYYCIGALKQIVLYIHKVSVLVYLISHSILKRMMLT